MRPLCLGYTETHENKSPEKEILMVGDDKGYVTVFPLDAADWDQEPKSDGKPEGKPGDDGLKVKKASRVKYHKDWVTKVGFVSQLQAMVTCSLDGEINICDVHTNQRKEGRDAVRLHKKGVHSWCWCKSYKFFASGGSDRQIIIWNPYTQKAMNYLQGHNAPVLDVLVNEAQHQLISMSVDKVVKALLKLPLLPIKLDTQHGQVWDILNYQCIQTFTDKTEYKPEDRLTCMAFDEEGPALVLCSSLINVLPVSVKVETSRTHLAPIVGALHNDVFHQIISGDNMGTISVWDIQTGKLEFEFRRAHQDHKMTCMAFDRSKRCLYTGGEEGAVKLWNFSSGQQLRTFTMKQPAEIRSLLWAKEGPNSFVVGLAWDRRIYVEPQYVLEDFTGQGHTDDVTCLSRLSSVSGLLATGGDDGYVCFWKIQETSAGHGASSRRYRLFDTSQAPSQGVTSTEGIGDRIRKGRKGTEGQTTGNKRVSHTFQPQGYVDSPSSLQTGEGHSNGWPEDLSGLEADTGLASVGVERTVFLEHKACLLTIHADGSPRLWSTKQAEFLGKLDYMSSPDEAMEDRMEVITSVYADDDNTWLFTGHADGWVRIWDLTRITAQKLDVKTGLLLFKEMHLHQMAVTSLQHFEISGKVVIVSASADWTVALHTMDGIRIGNFSHRYLTKPHGVISRHLPLKRASEGLRMMTAGVSVHEEVQEVQVAGVMVPLPTMAPFQALALARSQSQVRTRPVIPPPVHSGQGDFGKLSVVKRFKPDLTLAEQEKQRLQKIGVSENTHRSGKVWSRR
eukprot:symbB.v1.2.030838.t1/scaffold3409.1/size109594/6